MRGLVLRDRARQDETNAQKTTQLEGSSGRHLLREFSKEVEEVSRLVPDDLKETLVDALSTATSTNLLMRSTEALQKRSCSIATN